MYALEDSLSIYIFPHKFTQTYVRSFCIFRGHRLNLFLPITLKGMLLCNVKTLRLEHGVPTPVNGRVNIYRHFMRILFPDAKFHENKTLT